jgi:hypothetical protein
MGVRVYGMNRERNNGMLTAARQLLVRAIAARKVLTTKTKRDMIDCEFHQE